jgi:hypothetical protein
MKNPTAMENGGVKTKEKDLSSGWNCAPQKRMLQPQKAPVLKAVPGVAKKSHSPHWSRSERHQFA